MVTQLRPSHRFQRLTARTHVAHQGHVMRATPATGPHDDVVSMMTPMGRLPAM